MFVTFLNVASALIIVSCHYQRSRQRCSFIQVLRESSELAGVYINHVSCHFCVQYIVGQIS